MSEQRARRAVRSLARRCRYRASLASWRAARATPCNPRQTGATRHPAGPRSSREQRNRRVEGMTVFGEHLIGPAHRPDRGFEVRATAVFEALARFEQRLLADDAEALDLEHLVVGVRDDPVAADELSGDAAGVSQHDRVSEDVLVLGRIGLFVD